ncbi:hypothetical protein FH972_023600 [Carpinus fangiana]|uniref:Uncharacterized protein n=1 Tax=Carpinus fangiana TaxID=176857 RepID=A0A5N6KW14_9ROSI|nr:hypothetical protein FH972_023600 [Carpinus fangiana]
MSVPDSEGFIRQVMDALAGTMNQEKIGASPQPHNPKVLESYLTPASTDNQGFPASLQSRGDYLVWAAKFVAQVARDVAHQDIDQPQPCDLRKLESCLVDFSFISHVRDKDRLIQSIADTLNRTADDIAKRWREFERPEAPDRVVIAYDPPAGLSSEIMARWPTAVNLHKALRGIIRENHRSNYLCPFKPYCDKVDYKKGVRVDDYPLNSDMNSVSSFRREGRPSIIQQQQGCSAPASAWPRVSTGRCLELRPSPQTKKYGGIEETMRSPQFNPELTKDPASPQSQNAAMDKKPSDKKPSGQAHKDSHQGSSRKAPELKVSSSQVQAAGSTGQSGGSRTAPQTRGSSMATSDARSGLTLEARHADPEPIPTPSPTEADWTKADSERKRLERDEKGDTTASEADRHTAYQKAHSFRDHEVSHAGGSGSKK